MEPVRDTFEPTSSPMIEREIDILARAGVLPPMPDVLLQAGGLVEVDCILHAG